MDIFRALFLVIGLLVLEKLDSAHSRNDAIRKCQYIPRFYISQLKGKACLQSQMADESRYALRNIFDQIRSNTAKGVNPQKQTYNNVFQLNYHWISEYFAMKLLDSSDLDDAGQLEEDNVTAIQTEMANTILNDVGLGLGSFGSSGTKILENYFSYARFAVPDSESPVYTQSALIKFVTNALNTTEVDFTREGVPIYAGTTYFGCAVRVNVGTASKQKRQSSDSSVMMCVFTTRSDADLEFKEGKMTADTCKAAIPKAAFDAEANLCVDMIYRTDSSRELDIPCQFYYTNVSGGGPPTWMKMSCKGANLNTDMLFTGLKKNTQVIYRAKKIMVAAYVDKSGGDDSGARPGGDSRIIKPKMDQITTKDAALKLRGLTKDTQAIYGDNKIMVEVYADKNGGGDSDASLGGNSGNETTAKDAALKLHSIPISTIIFIASTRFLVSLN